MANVISFLKIWLSIFNCVLADCTVWSNWWLFSDVEELIFMLTDSPVRVTHAKVFPFISVSIWGLSVLSVTDYTARQLLIMCDWKFINVSLPYARKCVGRCHLCCVLRVLPPRMSNIITQGRFSPRHGWWSYMITTLFWKVITRFWLLLFHLDVF